MTAASSAPAPANPLPFPVLLAGAVLATAVPTLLAYNVSPSATFLNQALSFAGWGVLVALFAAQLPEGSVPWLTPASEGATAVFAVMLLCALLSPLLAALPWSLALSAIGTLVAALLVLWVGVITARIGLAKAAADAAFGALLLGGALNMLIAFIQFFKPAWVDGDLIAHATAARPGGNLRQANHLSSLLMLSACALVWWAERAREKWPEFQRESTVASALLMAGLMVAGALTASRTGGICVLLLAAWGVVDRSLSRSTRVLLAAAPVLFALSWWGLSEWASLSGTTYGGDSQLHSADLSSSRLGIWKNTLQLIAQNPWFGVGWGDFNFAWTLTPFPGRPVAFFDHTHDLPLQWIVELGLPLGIALCALSAWVLWKTCSLAWNAPPALRGVARSACAMVVIMVVHSLVEYPLWYAYFLLPTVFALGLALGAEAPMKEPPAAPSRGKKSQLVAVAEPRPVTHQLPLPQGRALLMAAGALMLLGSAGSVLDYKSVVDIFVPPANSASLTDRIERGQQSVFFAHHADYAAVTTADPPSSQMEGFRRSTHYLLDTRIMMDWAQALHEIGQEDKARYVAQRLKEFRNPAADEFFAPCKDAAQSAKAFQCLEPSRQLRFQDFRDAGS